MSNLTFVISSFGKGSLQKDGHEDPFIDSVKNSIKNIYPNVDIIVSCNELDDVNKDKINNLIEEKRNECKFLKDSPGSLKLVTHYHAWEFIKTKWVVFLDSDMLLLKNIDKYLDESIDYIFTWRKKDMTQAGSDPWLNAGTMICKNTPEVRDFWKKYYERMWVNAFEHSRGDQFGFVELLPEFNKRINKGKELFKLENSSVINFKEQNINFRAIHVDYLNRSDPYSDWFEETAIQHLKGIQGTIITQTSKNNRYNNFLNHTLPNMSEANRKNLKIRIDLWKKFAKKEIADKIISL